MCSSDLSSDNPLHWNNEKTKILRMFKRSLASGSDGTGSKRLPGKPRIRLLLGSTYRGGVWELVRNLISELVDLNNRIGSIDLSLLVTPEQDLAGLNLNSKDLDVGRIQLQILPVHQVAWEFGDSFFPASKGRQLYAWPADSRKDSIQPDAIFAMVDRFNLPMPPRVPFGVWIYDMIQEKFPEGFPKAFFEIYEEAMKPTVALAQVAEAQALSGLGPAAAGVAFVAGLMRGFAGFGSAMFMAPIFAVIFGSAEMIATVAAMELAVSVQLFPAARRGCQWSIVGPMAVAAIVFLPVGRWLLLGVDATILAKAVALIVLG